MQFKTFNILSSLSFVLPGIFLGEGSTFDFISRSLRFFSFLKAVRGVSLKNVSKCLSWITIDFQCLAIIGCKAGILLGHT